MGFDANENPPVLRPHDRFGHRIDRVDYHPSYHRLMETAVRAGLHATPWATGPPRPPSGPGRRFLRLVAGGGRPRMPDLLRN